VSPHVHLLILEHQLLGNIIKVNNLMQLGLGHILFIAYKSISTLKSIPYQWKFYLASWSIDEFYVSPPLLDFECLSNGYLWFNQFMKKKMAILLVIISHPTKLLQLWPFFISNVVMRLTLLNYI
jgi:hypothetical protein